MKYFTMIILAVAVVSLGACAHKECAKPMSACTGLKK